MQRKLSFVVMSAYMVSIRQNLISNFARKPRSLFEFSTWKATELQNPVQQLVRGIHEKQKVASQKTTSVFSPLKQLHFSGPMINSIATWEQYRCYNDGQTLISTSRGDNCFSVGGRVLIVRNILSHSGTVEVLCNFFKTDKNLKKLLDKLSNGLLTSWNSFCFQFI